MTTVLVALTLGFITGFFSGKIAAARKLTNWLRKLPELEQRQVRVALGPTRR